MRYVADVDGDGKADLVGFRSNGIRVSFSNGKCLNGLPLDYPPSVLAL